MYTAFSAVYDRLTANVDYRRRADYFCKAISRHAGWEQGENRLLLDLACGTGTLSYLWQERGYDVIGVDGSEGMLAQAMEKGLGRERRPLFLCQKMEELDLYGTVDVAVCALDSLNHLPSREALRGAFSRLALFLETDGFFLFDVNTPYKHERVLSSQTFVYDLEDVYCVWQNGKCDRGRIDISLDIFELGREGSWERYEEHFCEQAYTYEELQEVGEEAGFELVACYHEDSFEPPREDSQRLVYVMKNRTLHHT